MHGLHHLITRSFEEPSRQKYEEKIETQSCTYILTLVTSPWETSLAHYSLLHIILRYPTVTWYISLKIRNRHFKNILQFKCVLLTLFIFYILCFLESKLHTILSGGDSMDPNEHIYEFVVS